MTVVDWVLIVVWLGLTLGGFWKGAVRMIFGGGGLAVGLWLAVIAGAGTVHSRGAAGLVKLPVAEHALQFACAQCRGALPGDVLAAVGVARMASAESPSRG